MQKTIKKGLKSEMAMKREKKAAAYTSPLPPCKICGAKASGLHYGVNTCEACKGFFRRAIKFQKRYRCFRQQKCDVVGGRSVRTSCPFCRLQKCINMGMAHTAIKTGRYTHAKRTENIMEVKRLEYSTKSSPEYSQSSNASMDSGLSPSADVDFFCTSIPGAGSDFYNSNSTTSAMAFPVKIKSEIENSQPHQPCSFDTNHPMVNAAYPGSMASSEMLPETAGHSGNLGMVAIHDENSPWSFQGQPSHMKTEIMDLEDSVFCANFPKPAMDTRDYYTPSETEGVYISIPSPPFPSPPSSCSPPSDAPSSSLISTIPSDILEMACPSVPPGPSAIPVYGTSLSLEPSHLGTCLPLPVSPSLTQLTPLSSPLSTSSSLSSVSSYPEHSEPEVFTLASASTEKRQQMKTSSSSMDSTASYDLTLSPSVSPLSLSSSQSSSSSSSCLKSSQPLPEFELPPKDGAEMKALVDSLVSAHRQHVITLGECDRQFIRDRQLSYRENFNARVETFGISCTFLKDEFYEEIFSQTGLDVDNRQEKYRFLWQSTNMFARTTAMFAKAVPGFTTLCTADQAELIAASYKEQWFLNAYLGVNQDLSIIMMPNHNLFTMSEFAWVFSMDLAEKVFEMAPAFQELDIEYQLVVLWKVVLLFTSDRVELQEPEKVSRLQSIYVHCLTSTLKQLRPDEPGLFARIISLSCRLRDFEVLPMAPRTCGDNLLELVLQYL